MKRCALSLAVLVFVCLPALANAEATIENNWLRVSLSPDDGLKIADKSTGDVVVRRSGVADGAEVKAKAIEESRWGRGRSLILTNDNGSSTSMSLFESSPFLHIQTTISNSDAEPMVVASLPLFQADVDLQVPPEKLRSYGTGFLKTLDEPSTSFSFMAVVEPETRRGVVAAQLTHDQSSGVFTMQAEQGTVSIEGRFDYGRFQVEPGQSRETDVILLGCFQDTRLGLEAYADAVAEHYDIKLKPQAVDYCTWYHARASDEERLAENTEFAAKHLAPYGLDVIQIDDGWQILTPSFCEPETQKRGRGPIKTFVETNEKYPSGMAATAENIGSHGMTAGIWFMPFAGGYRTSYFANKQDLFAHWPDSTPIEDPRWSGTLLDLTNPKTQAYVHDRTKRIYDWGYRYFKLDGMHTGTVTHNVYVNTDWRTEGHSNTENFIGTQEAPGKSRSRKPSAALHDPAKTHIQAYRIGLDMIRRAAPETFVLGCNVSQNMRSMGAAFDKIDAMRIGPDNGSGGRGDWNGVVKGPRHGTNLYFLNARVWHNDPDPVYVRESNPLESARWMVSWVAVTGSMLTTSEQFSELPPERLDLLRRAMPSVFRTERSGEKLVARPVDLFESKDARIWLLSDARREARRDIIGLFNWSSEEEETIEYPLDRIGLDGDGTYVAFDYWANRFTEPMEGMLRETLPAGTCRVLAVRLIADHPQLLSTSRHITQGVVDVLEEMWDADARKLSGRSLLVADDPYELRIALPSGEKWTAIGANIEGGATIEVGEATDLGVRVWIQPAKSGEVAWSVRFAGE